MTHIYTNRDPQCHEQRPKGEALAHECELQRADHGVSDASAEGKGIQESKMSIYRWHMLKWSRLYSYQLFLEAWPLPMGRVWVIN